MKDIDTYLERVEKIEMAGVKSQRTETERAITIKILKEWFESIRKNAPVAYVRLMGHALSQPSTGKREYINRISLFSRLAGYALIYSMQNESMFERIMAINDKPVVEMN